MASDVDKIAALERRVAELEHEVKALKARDPQFAAGSAEAIDVLTATLEEFGALPPGAFEKALREKIGRIQEQARQWPQVEVLRALLPADRPQEQDRSPPPGPRGPQQQNRRQG